MQQETGCVAFQMPFDVSQWNEGTFPVVGVTFETGNFTVSNSDSVSISVNLSVTLSV